jgi:uncharacterized protein
MARHDNEYPGLPIKLNPCSNGEFIPEPPSDVVRETVRRARVEAEQHARRIGMSRRRFLLSSMGAATTLSVLAACSSEAARDRATGSIAPGAAGSAPGGSYVVPPDAKVDPDAARQALGGDEFIMDVQTHFLDNSHDAPNLGVMFPQNNCGERDPRECFSVDKYLDLLYNKSDTNVVVISALPFAGSPLDSTVMRQTIELADRLCGDTRTLMQGEAHPGSGAIEQTLENMAQLKASLPIGAWKTYTHAGGRGWFLDDRDPSAPQVGQRFIDQARRLGPKVIAVHKGFPGIGGDATYSDPVDVGPAATANPDMNFVVYHSGFEGTNGLVEKAYDEKDRYGINRLIASVTKAGLGPGRNVYAEIGSTWRYVMGDTTQAAHILGKLLKTFGEDNVVWGTDSIWYGSPQDQIQAFRAFEISKEFQDRYGYPELTPAVKAKIFGLTSARLYGITPVTTRCRIDREGIEHARLTSFEGNYTLGPVTPRQVAAVTRAELAQFQSFT